MEFFGNCADPLTSLELLHKVIRHIFFYIVECCRPLVLLIEMGIEKLKRDSTHYLLSADLVSKEAVDPYLVSSGKCCMNRSKCFFLSAQVFMPEGLCYCLAVVVQISELFVHCYYYETHILYRYIFFFLDNLKKVKRLYILNEVWYENWFIILNLSLTEKKAYHVPEVPEGP